MRDRYPNLPFYENAHSSFILNYMNVKLRSTSTIKKITTSFLIENTTKMQISYINYFGHNRIDIVCK